MTAPSINNQTVPDRIFIPPRDLLLPPVYKIEEILNQVKLPILETSPEKAIELKESYKKQLNQAYLLTVEALSNEKKYPGMLYSCLGEIMMKYGRLRYEENYPSCMVMMRGSLYVQLLSCGLLDRMSLNIPSGNLIDLETGLFDHKQFEAFDQLILTSSMEAVAQQIQHLNLSPEKLIQLGFTLSWMANSLHHTQGFREKEEDKSVEACNHLRFDQIYSICEKILLMANHEKANLELAELYYNGLRGVELRKDPKNIEGAHRWLDRAKELNPSFGMAARVANLKSCDWANAGNIELAKAFLDEAIKIRESFLNQDYDPFHVANLYSRKAGFLLKELKLEEADEAIDRAIAYSTGCRGRRDPETDKLLDRTHDHQYFGIYDWKKAQIKFSKNELPEAMRFINRSLETFEHHKQDSEDLIKMALEVKNQIEARLNQ